MLAFCTRDNLRSRFSPVRLHRDERGTISIVTVFAVLLLVMVLGMVMNVGRDVDDKIRMQNAADAAAYSGGVVLARGMNTLTFSNHLLFDVFALTAVMREARDRNAEQYVPEILAAWENVAPKFAGSGFEKFERLSQAIPQKVPLEQELVTTFSDWGAAASEILLPTLEAILAEEMIPQFERAVVWAYPEIAQEAVMQCAARNSSGTQRRGPMLGALWRTNLQLVGGIGEQSDRSLAVVDPIGDSLLNQSVYLNRAREQRQRHAERYLGLRPGSWYYAGGWQAANWNDELLWMFDHEAKMGRFASLWRGFTCGYLHELLEDEYPSSNLPFLIATERDEILDANSHLEQHFTFLAVVYREELPKMFPGLFYNPADCDSLAYATARVFIPERRLVWHHWTPTQIPPMRGLGGMPGNPVDLPEDDTPSIDEPEGDDYWFVGRESGVSEAWNLLNQHWTAQLVPTTQQYLAETLQTMPPLPEFAENNIRLPNLGGMSSEEIGRISTH